MLALNNNDYEAGSIKKVVSTATLHKIFSNRRTPFIKGVIDKIWLKITNENIYDHIKHIVRDKISTHLFRPLQKPASFLFKPKRY